MCQRCDVRQDCLDFALTHDERDGIWGGLTSKERKKLATSTVEVAATPRPTPLL
jgi:WhiB family redox-sensing transcriptional regulator